MIINTAFYILNIRAGMSQRPSKLVYIVFPKRPEEMTDHCQCQPSALAPIR
jgi:hypothetical protein